MKPVVAVPLYVVASDYDCRTVVLEKTISALHALLEEKRNSDFALDKMLREEIGGDTVSCPSAVKQEQILFGFMIACLTRKRRSARLLTIQAMHQQLHNYSMDVMNVSKG